MKSRTLLVSTLLFGSGAGALVYQTVWLREFCMIFGGSPLLAKAEEELASFSPSEAEPIDVSK